MLDKDVMYERILILNRLALINQLRMSLIIGSRLKNNLSELGETYMTILQ